MATPTKTFAHTRHATPTGRFSVHRPFESRSCRPSDSQQIQLDSHAHTHTETSPHTSLHTTHVKCRGRNVFHELKTRYTLAHTHTETSPHTSLHTTHPKHVTASPRTNRSRSSIQSRTQITQDSRASLCTSHYTDASSKAAIYTRRIIHNGGNDYGSIKMNVQSTLGRPDCES